MPTFDLDLALDAGASLDPEELAEFTVLLALGAGAGLAQGSTESLNRDLTFTVLIEAVFREFVTRGALLHLDVGLGLLASMVRWFTDSVTLGATAGMAQALTIAQTVAPDPASVEFATVGPTVAMGAITVVSEPITLEFTEQPSLAGTGQICRFSIMGVRKRVGVRMLVVSDGQAR